ncbi:hypothetical protein BT63DRAFT_378963 [Microthyrium microscopicum]|uniref:lytic cellulose monooxygenase (C4-dehydrogenating) n=1 Tax=Microthyrium microscopicum TaxID=703497 RepID=A0A6A6TWQ5_9PEZI|nr:hypothetical protein BT63DRAFT_378963 [Microthyrium microscopicum]
MAEGFGPVIDAMSPDISCRNSATAPALKAVARAGAQIEFKWTKWMDSHKGPILTYMGPWDGTQKAQEIPFFKIQQTGYDPKTRTWASDTFMKQNQTWTAQIPSDIEPGLYVLRHELMALHVAEKGSPTSRGTPLSGAQFYPICFSIQVTGDGTVTPDGVKFPGGYKYSDPGLLTNIYNMTGNYSFPGPAVYQGKYDAPQGPAPVVTETGALKPAEVEQLYEDVKARADRYGEFVVTGANNAMLNGGACFHDEVGAAVNPLEKCGGARPYTNFVERLGKLTVDGEALKKELGLGEWLNYKTLNGGRPGPFTLPPNFGTT